MTAISFSPICVSRKLANLTMLSCCSKPTYSNKVDDYGSFYPGNSSIFSLKPYCVSVQPYRVALDFSCAIVEKLRDQNIYTNIYPCKASL